MNGHIDVVKLLVEIGHKANISVGINSPNNFGSTPLAMAVMYNHVDVAEYLLNYSYQTNTCVGIKTADSYGRTPIELATIYGYYNMIELFIRFGGDITNIPIHEYRNDRLACILLPFSSANTKKTYQMECMKVNIKPIDMTEDEILSVKYRVCFSLSLTNQLLNSIFYFKN